MTYSVFSTLISGFSKSITTRSRSVAMTLFAALVGVSLLVVGGAHPAKAGRIGSGLGTGIGLGIGIEIGKQLFKGAGKHSTRGYKAKRPRRGTRRGTRRSTRAGRRSIRHLQNSLLLLGFYAANTNGRMDDNTRLAITKYQTAKGIYPSGKLDAQQTKLLEREAETAQILAHLGNPNAGDAFVADPKKRLQAALKVMGHYSGRIDGKFGNGSKNAVARYQNSINIQATRVLSRDQEATLITSARSRLDEKQLAINSEYQQIATQQLAQLKQSPGTSNGQGTTIGQLPNNTLPRRRTVAGNTNLQLAGLPAIERVRANSHIRRDNDIAVIIGNRNYQAKGIPNVSYGRRDADAMKALLVNDLGFDASNVIDARDANFKEMRAIFGSENNHKGRIWRFVDPEGKSNVFVFYSGHGAPDLNSNSPYLVPVDAHPDEVALNGYPLDLVYKNLNKLPIKTATVFLDACFSGESPNGMIIKSTSPVMLSASMPAAANYSKLTVLTAAGPGKVASWDDKAGHGFFTRYVISGLKGSADANGDNNITAKELHGYLKTNVRKSARRAFGRVQIPVLHGNGDIIINSVQ